MDVLTIANTFSVRKGYIYRYTGPNISGDPGVSVTEKLSLLLRRNDFVSSVVQFQNNIYVYINEVFPEDLVTDDFSLLGNVEQAMEDFNLRQVEYFKSLEPPPEPQPTPEPPPEPELTSEPPPEPEPEEPQNAS
jgi:hypothetical protein